MKRGIHVPSAFWPKLWLGVSCAIGLGVLGVIALGGCSPQAADRGTGAPSNPGKVPPMSPTSPTSSTAAVKLKLLADLTGPYGTHLAFDREGKRWALADSRNIQLGSDGVLDSKLTSPDVIHDVAWSPDGKLLLACPMSYDLGLGAWQKRPSLGKALIGGLAAPPPVEQVGIAAGTCSPDGKELIAATRFQPTRELGGEDSYNGPDERLLAIAFDGGSGAPALRGELYAGELEQRAIAVGEKLIAAGGSTVQVWDRQTLRKVSTLKHKLVARALAFNADGDRLAVLTADGVVSLWDPAAGTLLTSFTAHEGDGYTLAFHPTRPLLATGGQDGKLRLWSLAGATTGASGATIGAPIHDEQLGGWVQAVAFAASGTRLAAVARTSPPHLVIYELSPP